MLDLMILAAAAAASPAVPTAPTVVITAPRRDFAGRHRLPELPPEARSGPRRLNPLLRLSF